MIVYIDGKKYILIEKVIKTTKNSKNANKEIKILFSIYIKEIII